MKQPASSVALTKRALNRAMFAGLEQHLGYEADLQEVAADSDEHRTRLQAMIDRGLTLTEVVASVGQAADAVPSPSGHDWPPMITLGSDEFRFVTSSAELSEDFRTRLETETVQQLQDLLASYDVDVIEVVGHTDEQPINSTQRSTLDTLAIPRSTAVPRSATSSR